MNLQHIIMHDVLQSRFYYEGNLNTYQVYIDRRNHNHEFGYDGIVPMRNGASTIYLGTSWIRNLDKADYTIYDHFSSDYYLNLKHYLADNLISRIGYVLSSRNYDELPAFSYREHLVYVRLNTYFQSGTSLSGYINYGLKNYSNMVNDGLADASTDQVVIFAKVAQSLSSRSAISLSYLNRFKPGLVDGETTVLNTVYLFTEDELFDDRYGYSGTEISSKLIYYLPYNIKSELSIGSIQKKYHHRLVIDEYGEFSDEASEIRRDRRYYGWFSLSRSFKIDKLIDTATMYLSTGYLKNLSNDNYYDFNNIYMSLGVELNIEQ